MAETKGFINGFNRIPDNAIGNGIVADLAKITCCARQNSLYYKNCIPAFDENTFEIVWNKIPLLSKDLLRDNYNDMITDYDSAKGFDVFTTGSSGIPTVTKWTNTEYNKSTMEVWKRRKSAGGKLTDNIIYFLGLPDPQNPSSYLIKKTSDRVYEAVRVFTIESVRMYIDFINNLGEVIIYASPSTMCAFANVINDNKLDAPKVNCIELNGEILSKEEKRVILNTFNSPIINNYGGREMWPIALTCEHGIMHVCNNLVYVESINGELIITSLTKKLQPLIRYQIGDLGEVDWIECKCGKSSQVITNLIGRKNDYIYREPNKKEHWATLSLPITEFVLANEGTIKEYAVHQHKDYTIELIIVEGANFSERVKSDLIKVCKSIYPNLQIIVNTAKTIPQNHRGKRIYLQSDVCS